MPSKANQMSLGFAQDAAKQLGLRSIAIGFVLA
jgi:hypothetical protein